MKEGEKRKILFLYQPSSPGVAFIIAACKISGLTIKPMLKMSDLWDAWAEYDEIVLIHTKVDISIFDAWELFLDLAISSIPSYMNPLDLQAEDEYPQTQTVLEIMKQTGLLKNAQDSQNPEKWKGNKIAARYGKALKTAKIFLDNQDNPTALSRLFEDAAIEILYGKENKEITTFEKSISRCNEALKNALNKINLKNYNIAYAYLDNLSPWLDLSELQKEIFKLHGFLSILQYRKNNKELTWIGSNGKFNINEIFNIKNNKKSPYAILIEGPHQEVQNRIFYQIKQFFT
jgi:hypothetical protein